MAEFNYDDLVIEDIPIETMPLTKLMDKKGKWKYDASSVQFGMSVEMQYSKLLLSVKDKGQTRAVYIWRGRIMDGRNRCKALLEAGIDTVKVRRFPNQMDEEQRRQIAKDEEMARRHETATQIACTATKEWFRLNDAKIKTTRDDILLQYPTSSATMSLAVWLYKNQFAVFNDLFNGKPYPIPLFDGNGMPLVGRDGKPRFDTTDILSKIVFYSKAKAKEEERIRLAQLEEDMREQAEDEDMSEDDGYSDDENQTLAILYDMAEKYISGCKLVLGSAYNLSFVKKTMMVKLEEAEADEIRSNEEAKSNEEFYNDVMGNEK